jgi:hypothetical protein
VKKVLGAILPEKTEGFGQPYFAHNFQKCDFDICATFVILAGVFIPVDKSLVM